MHFHTPTLFMVNIAVTTTLSLCLGAVAQRARRDGLPFWAWALASHSLVFILYSLRGQVSDLASIVLANTLLAATFALFAEGLYLFQQRPARRWLIWSPVALMAVAFWLLLDQPKARIVTNALILSAQCLWMVRLLAEKRQVTVGRGQYFVATGLLLVALALLHRAFMTMFGQQDMSAILSSNHVQAITFLTSTITIILISLGLVLMTKERADARNLTLAMQDELTGLSNRRSILELLTQQMGRAQRQGHALALLMIDIDYFKRINDTFGHLSGDKALRELTNCIRARLRVQDMAGRLGGEEFLVILPDTEARGAHQLAEQLRQTVAQTRFESVDGTTMPLTISIGIHERVPSTRESCDDLISAADQALYLAKQNGRNRVEQA